MITYGVDKTLGDDGMWRMKVGTVHSKCTPDMIDKEMKVYFRPCDAGSPFVSTAVKKVCYNKSRFLYFVRSGDKRYTVKPHPTDKNALITTGRY